VDADPRPTASSGTKSAQTGLDRRDAAGAAPRPPSGRCCDEGPAPQRRGARAGQHDSPTRSRLQRSCSSRRVDRHGLWSRGPVGRREVWLAIARLIEVGDTRWWPARATYGRFRLDVGGSTAGVYLTRWRLVDSHVIGIYLHRISRPDSDRPAHSHPWNFVTIVLRGGYTEARFRGDCLQLVEHRLLSPKRVLSSPGHFHRIISLRSVPTWTIIVRGRRRHQWGFAET
jgi:hypothetical protein